MREKGSSKWYARTAARRGLKAGLLIAMLVGAIAALAIFVGWSRTDDWHTLSWRRSADQLGSTAVDQAVRLLHAPRLWLERGIVEVVDPKPRASESVRVDGLERASPAGVATARRIILRQPRLAFDLQVDDQAPRLDLAALAHLLEPIGRGAFHELLVVDGTVRFPQVRGERKVLRSVSLKIVPGAIGTNAPTSVDGAFRIRRQRIAVTAQIWPKGSDTAATGYPIKLRLKGGQLQLDFDGTVKLGADGSVDARGMLDLALTDPGAAAQWLGRPLAGLHMIRTIRVTGPVVYADGLTSLENARVMVDQSQAGGTIALDQRPARPILHASLGFRSLHVSPYVAHLPALFDYARTSSSRPSSSSDGLDADIRFSAELITGLGELPAGKGSVSLVIRGNTLVADVPLLELAQASVSGQVRATLSGAPHDLGLRLRTVNLDLSPKLMAALGLPLPPVQGVASINLNLAAKGDSADEITRNLTGELAVEMPNGGHSAVNLRQLALDTRRGSGTVNFADRAGMRFDSLSARLAVRGGRLITESVQMQSGKMRIVGEGSVGLSARNMYLRLLMDHGPLQAWDLIKERHQSVVLMGPWSRIVAKDDTVGGQVSFDAIEVPAVATSTAR
jgi:hypothetical protein